MTTGKLDLLFVLQLITDNMCESVGIGAHHAQVSCCKLRMFVAYASWRLCTACGQALYLCDKSHKAVSKTGYQSFRTQLCDGGSWRFGGLVRAEPAHSHIERGEELI